MSAEWKNEARDMTDKELLELCKNLRTFVPDFKPAAERQRRRARVCKHEMRRRRKTEEEKK